MKIYFVKEFDSILIRKAFSGTLRNLPLLEKAGNITQNPTKMRSEVDLVLTVILFF